MKYFEGGTHLPRSTIIKKMGFSSSTLMGQSICVCTHTHSLAAYWPDIVSAQVHALAIILCSEFVSARPHWPRIVSAHPRIGRQLVIAHPRIRISQTLLTVHKADLVCVHPRVQLVACSLWPAWCRLASIACSLHCHSSWAAHFRLRRHTRHCPPEPRFA
jgi:hypothetical protein